MLEQQILKKMELSINNRDLDPEGREDLAEKLDELLLDYQQYSRNVRKIHWDAKLRPYLDFSEKLDILYNVTDQNTRVLAEKILNLGYSPSTQPEDTALFKSRLHPIPKPENLDQSIFAIIRMSQELLETVDEVFYTAASYEEEQSMYLMKSLGQQLKFTIWVFSSVRAAMNN